MRGLSPASSGWLMVTIGPQCWRNRMTFPECMLCVDVEGWKNHVVGYGSAAAVGPLAWRVRDFKCWLITDGRAGSGNCASEN